MAFKKSFFPATIDLWNNLDPRLANCTSLYSFKREIKKQAPIPPNYFAQCTRKENIILCQLRNSKSQLNGDLYQDHLSDSTNCIHCDCPETIDHFILKCPKYVNERIDLINSLITQPNIYENITICVNDLLFGNPNLSNEENCALLSSVILYINQTNRL